MDEASSNPDPAKAPDAISFNDVQLLNIREGIYVKVFGNTTFVKNPQYWQHLPPILVTEFGTTIETMFVSENAS